MDFRFINNSTMKVIGAALAAGAVVVVQELTKSKVVPLLSGAPAATNPTQAVATNGPVLPPPAPSPAVPSPASPAAAPDVIPVVAANPPAPSTPVEIQPQVAPDPTTAAPPPAPADPLPALFKGEFDQALTIARTNGKDEALTEGLESFAQAGRLIQKGDWTGARDALRNAERTPALKKLSLYWRCRVSKLEIGAENFDRCASEAGVNPSAYR